MSQTLPPFSCTMSPNMAELLFQLNCTLALSTYQAGKVIFLSALNENEIVQLPRDFEKAMGMAISGQRLAVATKSEVVVLANSKALAINYPGSPNKYDGLYLPRATYYTGEVDLHDMSWGNEGLWAVNTRFSCLSLIDDEYSFQIKWKPNFITDLTPDDRCHLNGMAMQDGKPKYVTALGKTDSPKAWRSEIQSGGLLIDVDSNEIVASGLPMPHSPRIYDGKVYVLCSATGELVTVDVNTGKYDVVTKLDGFVRGMSKIGDYLFVGLSKLRQNASTFRDLPIARNSIFSGVVAVHLPSGLPVAHIKYENSVEEIYDVQILPGIRRPAIMNTNMPDHKKALVTNHDAYWSVPEPERGF
jgi:uncharacterized protein (TIGR03032 family)